MPRTSEVSCWSCGKTGRPVPGRSWIRECPDCDVRWDATPPASSRTRDRMAARARYLDAIAGSHGLGNRQGFIDHGTVKLASPG